MFVIWAGKGGAVRGSSWTTGSKSYGITLTSGSNVLDALKAMKEGKLEGMVGGAYYYYEIPKNPVNDWLVREHKKRFNEPPDFFTCGGFAAAMAVVAGDPEGGRDRHREADRRDGGPRVPDAQGQDDLPQGGPPGAPEPCTPSRWRPSPTWPGWCRPWPASSRPQETAPPITNKR